MDTKHMDAELPSTRWPHVREFFAYLLAQPPGTQLDTKDLSVPFYQERFEDFASFYEDRYGDWLLALILYYNNNEKIHRYFSKKNEEEKPYPYLANVDITAVIFTRL